MRLAGHLVEAKCGLGLIQLSDPQQGGQTGLFSTFFEVLAGCMFFAVDGHRLLLKALRSSYGIFPLGGQEYAGSLLHTFLDVSSSMFGIALRVSAPVVVGLCLMEILLGVISRAIPQMNVFMVAQPAQLILALLLLVFGIPAVIWVIHREFPNIIYASGLLG
jgi:flagellar biosynthetic protein FliR